MAALSLISVAQYNQRLERSPFSLFPFRQARLFLTSSRCLTFLVLLDRTSNSTARLQRLLLLAPRYN